MRLNDASVLMDVQDNAIGSVDLSNDEPPVLPSLNTNSTVPPKKQILDSNSNTHLFMIDDEKKVMN